MKQRRTTIRLAEDVFKLLKQEAVEKNSTIQSLIDRCVRLYFHFPKESTKPSASAWGDLAKRVSKHWKGKGAVQEIREQREKGSP